MGNWAPLRAARAAGSSFWKASRCLARRAARVDASLAEGMRPVVVDHAHERREASSVPPSVSVRTARARAAST